MKPSMIYGLACCAMSVEVHPRGSVAAELSSVGVDICATSFLIDSFTFLVNLLSVTHKVRRIPFRDSVAPVSKFLDTYLLHLPPSQSLVTLGEVQGLLDLQLWDAFPRDHPRHAVALH